MNKLLKSTLVSSFIVLGCASAAPALADSFQGSTWSLSTGADLDPSSSFDEYLVTLTVDTTGYTGGGAFLEEVAIKVSSSLISASLFSAPGGAGAWSLSDGGINAGGCSGAGSGFECAASTTLPGGAAVPGVYSWIFDLKMDSGALFTGALESSVKGRFVDGNGDKIGALVSENVTLVPEPETYAMFLAGLGLMGFMARRRKTS